MKLRGVVPRMVKTRCSRYVLIISIATVMYIGTVTLQYVINTGTTSGNRLQMLPMEDMAIAPPAAAAAAAEEIRNNSKDGFHGMAESFQRSSFSDAFANLSFSEALAQVSSPRKAVLLAMVDESVHAMAINMYLTSLLPYGISNYIMLTIGQHTCQYLQQYGINCLFYKAMASSNKASSYGSQIFKDKMNVRTDFVLEALRLGYTVLHTDIDVYFFSDPFQSIACPRNSCDIAPLLQKTGYNAGFLLVNPSKASRRVYERMQKIAESNRQIDDQAQLNTAMKKQAKSGLRINNLPMEKFHCGLTYYEFPKRYFANTMLPCPECVVVHNNWIVSMAAKVYRAKELHQWMYDEEQYYSSTSTKYLVYNDTLPQQDALTALRSALAISKILNRVLILPAFYCQSVPCPLNSILNVSAFDSVFKYREHTFLIHPLVPESVKTSLSAVYLIETMLMLRKSADIRMANNITRIFAKNMIYGMNDWEIKEKFGNIKEYVLQFHSMYNAFSSFRNSKVQSQWQRECRLGLIRSNYRQMI